MSKELIKDDIVFENHKKKIFTIESYIELLKEKEKYKSYLQVKIYYIKNNKINNSSIIFNLQFENNFIDYSTLFNKIKSIILLLKINKTNNKSNIISFEKYLNKEYYIKIILNQIDKKLNKNNISLYYLNNLNIQDKTKYNFNNFNQYFDINFIYNNNKKRKFN